MFHDRTYSLLGISAALFMFVCGHARADDLLSPESWPTTVEAVVQDITARMSQSDKDVLRKKKKEDLIQFHHGWGTGIRNRYGLWRGNEKLLTSACGQPCHPDDASMHIIEAVWAAIQK